jgi:PAS domain S-box-containing protein
MVLSTGCSSGGEGQLAHALISVWIFRAQQGRSSSLNPFTAAFDAANVSGSRVLALWSWGNPGLHQLADALISLACLVISLFLILHYLRPWRRREVPYRGIVWLLAGFFLLCAASCLQNVVDSPANPLNGVVSLIMAGLSCTALLGLACQVCKTQAPCHPREFEKEMAERRRAEAELTQVNARLSALLDASTEVSIIATDPDGLITVFNPGAEQMLGYSAEEMVGKATPVLLHDADEVSAHAARLSAEFGTRIGGFSAFVERARRGGHEVREWTYIRKDGSRLTVLLAVTAVFDSEGQIDGFLGIATDVTERLRVERMLRSSESRFRRLVDANIFGVVFGDIDGNISDANDAFLEMVGYTRQEMASGRLPWDALVPPGSVRSLSRCRVELKRWGRCAPFELECQPREGQSLPVLLGVALLDENQPITSGAAVVAFCLDLTQQKHLEAQLRKHADELAEMDVRKNEFLAMLGHELRNPLAPIRNAVKIMKQRGSDDPDTCWAREVIDQQIRQMAHLIDDLLEISRVTRGKVRLQKEVVDVRTIVAYAVETSRPVIDAHGHRLSLALPPGAIKVDADPVRMAQVLSNLLNNAAKYTTDGGLIRLSIAEEVDHVVFRVRDNGIGIPPEMLARVFDLFAQADRSLDRSQGGLGLGLTLVRSLVEMHGGTVRAVSAGLDEGSEFHVRLPLWKPGSVEMPDDRPATAVVASPPPACSRRAPAARKVLVVDDNVTSARSLEKLLCLEGHEAHVVHDGPSVFEIINKRQFDVVFMDIGLPGMTGYEVAQRLRRQPELGNPLLVAVTGYAEDEARRLSREAGFDHHLVKPVDPETILALLSSLEWSEESDPPHALHSHGTARSIDR